MKRRRLSTARLSLPLAAALAALLAAPSAHAAIYYWDDNAATAGFGTAGASTGTWAAPTSGPTAGWSTSTTGVSAFAAVTTATTDTLNFGNGATGLGAGTITVSGTVDAGDMAFASGSGAIVLSGGTITLAAIETTTVNNTTDTISSVLAGAATSFTKAGTGILTLSGTNSYTGTTIINGGTLTLNSATGSLATTTPLTFSGTGTFNMDNTGAGGALTQTLGTLAFSAGQDTVQTTRTAAFDQAITFSSLAARTAGASGNFVNTGTNSATNGFVFTAAPTAGALIDPGIFYNGSAYATYDAGGFVRGFAAGDSNYLAAPTAATMGASTAASNVDLTTGNITAQTTVSANTINLRSNNIAMSGTSPVLSTNGLLSSGSATATLGGGTTPRLQPATAGGELVTRVDGGTDQLTISSIIQNNTSASALTKAGAGKLILSGASTYTGATVVDAGTLQAGVATSAFGSSSPVTVSSGATLALSTFSQTIGSLSGSGNVTEDATSGSALTIGGTGATFSGNITGGKSGTQSVAISVSGTEIFSGNNTFAGWITLNSGTLRLGSANPIGSTTGSGNLVFGSSGILQFSAANTTDYSGRIGNAQATKLDLNGQTVSWGGYGGTSSSLTLYDTAGGGIFNLGSVSPASSTGDSGSGAYTINSGTLNLKNAGSAANNTVTMAGGALSFDAAWNATYGDNIFYLGGLAASSSGAGYNIALQNNAGSPAPVTVAVGNANSTTYAANLSGAGALVKSGAGTLTLSGTGSTYSGLTTLQGGLLGITSVNNLSPNSSILFNGGGLQIQGTSLNTLSALESARTLIVNPGYPLWLDINAAGNTFTIDESLPVGGLVVSGAGTVSFPNSLSALTLNPVSGATATYTGIIANGAPGMTLTKTGAGTEVLQGANSYSGATYLSRGTLTLSANGSINQSSGITFNGGTLNLVNTSSADNTVTRVNTSNAITSSGGNLTVTNTANAVNYTTTIGAVSLNSGEWDILQATNQNSTGNQTLTLSGLTQSGSAAVTFSANTTGPQASGNKNMIRVNGITSSTSAGTIIGSYATVGTAANAQTDYAIYTSDGTYGYLTPAAIASSPESTWGTTANQYTMGAINSATLSATRSINAVRSLNNAVTVTATNANITLTGHALVAGDAVTFSAATMPTGLTAGTVYYVVSPAANTIQVSATKGGGAITPTTAGTTVVASGVVQLSSGNNLGTLGILNGCATTLNVIQSGGAGVVTLPTTSAGNLYVTTGSGAITISAPINDNTGALTLVKDGSGGTLTLSGTSNYSGGTVINAGTLAYSADTNLGLAGNRNITFNGSGTLSPSATSSLGTLTVNAGGNATITHGGALTFSSTTGSGSMTSSAANSNNTLNLGNASGFTGNLNLTCNGNGAGVGNVQVQFSSLGDGAGSALTLTGVAADSGQNASVALAGDAGPLTFNNRQVQIVATGGAGLANAMLANNNTSAANTWVINTNLLNNSARGGVGQHGYGGSYYQEFVLRGSNTGNNAFNGVIGDGVSNTPTQTYVVKTGAGKWILGGSNTFSGQVIVNQGTLSVSNINSATAAGPLGQGVVRLGGTTGAYSGGNFGGGNSGTLEYTGNGQTTDRPIQIGVWGTWGGNSYATDAGAGTILNDGAGALTFSAANFNPALATVSATRTLTLGGTYTGGTNQIQGIIQDNVAGTGKVAVTKNADGSIWQLSGANTYTGVTNVSGGTLSLSAIDVVANANPLGKSASAAANLLLADGATLQYTGSAASCDRLFTLNTTANNGTVTLDASGSGAVNFSNTGSVAYGTAAASKTRTLALTGSNTGNNTLAAVIGNNGVSTVAVAKSGAGTWVLSGTNTYTGATTLSGGTLALGKNSALAATTAVSIGSATLDAATFTNSVGTLNATGSAVIHLGTGATLAFADSHLISWTGALNLTGTFVSGSSLRFGTSSSGLTSIQLSQITATGYGSFALDSNGYLTATAGSGYAGWASTNAPTGTAADDYDGDGVSNGVEYVLGGSKTTNDLGKLPTITTTGGNMVFSFKRDQASIDGSTVVTIQVGTTLASWPDTYNVGADNGSSSPEVNIVKGVPTGFDTVTLTVLQAPDARKFARLHVFVP